MGGDAGIALFLFEYFKFTGDTRYREAAYNYTRNAIDSFQQTPHYAFADGLAGIGWLVLFEKELLDEVFDIEELLEQIDSTLEQWLPKEFQKGNYDYLHGAMGAGLYYMNRGNNSAKENLVKIVSFIKSLAIKDGSCYKWEFFGSGEKYPNQYNLSLSHGMPSIISFLIMCASYGVEVDQCKQLIAGGCNYIMNRQVDPTTYPFFWPHTASDIQQNNAFSRLAWCYGDLGVSITMIRAGRYLHDEKVFEKGQEALSSCASRRDLAKNRVQDFCFCHGSVGNMFCFLVANEYGLRDRELYSNTVEFWANATKEFEIYKEDGYCGYKTFVPMVEQHNPFPGILEGIGGIGLTYLTYLTGKTKWKEIFLL
ncbi:MAG TPA: lanthionine synthetase LanC family protein [Chryseosolibacter sp.]